MSQQNDDFISFEKALRDLQLQSEQLKKLVSEGEIRAFRDGDSMKFKKEDLDALRGGGADEDELVFADSLEDDTGMVTEELSEEDTLLADDDEDDEPVAAAPTRGGSRAAAAPAPRSAARSRIEVETDDQKEPVWVTAAIILGFFALLYGLMIVYTTASGGDPSGITSPFAPQGS